MPPQKNRHPGFSPRIECRQKTMTLHPSSFILPPSVPAWFPGETEVWRTKELLPTSVFAAKYRTVTIGSHQGQWDNNVTPYLAEIMDTADLPYVEELVICGPPQSGKTNACINIMLNNLYRFGGNGKFVMFPTESLAKLFYQIRLIPILKKTEPLAVRLFTDDKHFNNSEKVTLRDGTVIFPCWGSSASKLSSFPADFVWADEVDKNDSLTGVETDPLSLLEDRTRTARRRKVLKCSTPTTESGPIWQAYQKCLVRKVRHVTCPHCAQTQLMIPENLTWPGQLGLFADTLNRVTVESLNRKNEESQRLNDSPIQPGVTVESSNRKNEESQRLNDSPIQPDLDPEFLKSSKLARYVCAGCGALWDDLERNQAVRLGKWVSDSTVQQFNDSPGATLRPRSVGYHIIGLICPDISLSDIAAEIIRARSGALADERRLANSFLGIPHVTVQASSAGLQGLRYRAEEYGPHIPADACLLTAGADIQQDRIEVEIVAWGPGSQSWGIMYTVLWGDTRLPEVWDQLDRHLLQTFNHAHGATLGISRAFIDAGYVPQQVYRFTGPRRARGLYAAEGVETVDAPEVAGPSNRHRAGMAIPVYRLGVNRIKSQLFGYLALETVGPGYCHLPVIGDQGPGTSNGLSLSPVPGPVFRYPENWYSMIQAEHAVPLDKRPDLIRWEKRKGGVRNEAIDCRVYALAALLSMRVDLKGLLASLQNHENPQPRQRRIYSEGVPR
jgi:phage terminase large subunit GpA-like protein